MYEYKCKIVKVVDGDTVDVDIDLGFGVWLRDERVRLVGVDTPESRTSDKVEKLFGKAASAFVSSHLPVGSLHMLQTAKYDSKGKFGRILGNFMICGEDFVSSGTTINELLISSGNAVRYNAENKALVQEAHMANRTRLIAEGVITQAQVDEVS